MMKPKKYRSLFKMRLKCAELRNCMKFPVRPLGRADQEQGKLGLKRSKDGITMG